jgi:Asp-tRNA(Asn)/Glu-tRNA(Gln) amidotransferase A subunit family amidase
MTLNDLRYLSITEVAAGIRQKDFSSAELTKACLEQINAIDAKLHSFIRNSRSCASAGRAG